MCSYFAHIYYQMLEKADLFTIFALRDRSLLTQEGGLVGKEGGLYFS